MFALFRIGRSTGRLLRNRNRYYLWGTNQHHGLGPAGRIVVLGVCALYGLYVGLHAWQHEHQHPAPPQPSIQQQLQLPAYHYVTTPECENLQTGQNEPCQP